MAIIIYLIIGLIYAGFNLTFVLICNSKIGFENRIIIKSTIENVILWPISIIKAIILLIKMIKES